MCGIAGAMHVAGARQCVTAMMRLMTHRGPDASGVWEADDASVVLGHRRLAIIDLDERANQPMISTNGRFVVVYNGEVYNFREIRKSLEDLGAKFRTNGDTEVVLRAFQQWGIGSIDRFIGMFAFAIYDSLDNVLHLARDRVGVKPLYYSELSEGGVLFASELGALVKARQGAKISLDARAVRDFLHLGYAPGAQTVVAGIQKVQPGAVISFRRGVPPTTQVYWSAKTAFTDRAEDSRPVNELVDELDELLAEAFTARLVADVPVGIFLSSGTDSSLLAAVLAKHAGRDIATFTLGIGSGPGNEAPLARETAIALGTHHHEGHIDLSAVAGRAREMWRSFDEPLADSSCLASLAVAEMAARHVKVVLSADGGDELFGGYRRYIWAKRLELGVAAIPRSLRRDVGTRAGWLAAKAGRQKHVQPKFAIQLDRFGSYMNQGTAIDRYKELNSLWTADALQEISKDVSWQIAEPFVPSATGAASNLTAQLALFDLRYYLPDDLLMKVDRATMASSIEGRDTFLDHRIIEFAGRIPESLKIRQGAGKYLLKRLLQRYLPAHMVARPKRGFSIPFTKWMSEGWLDEITGSAGLVEFVHEIPGIDVEHVLGQLARFRNGESWLGPRIFALVVLCQWYRGWISG